MERERIIMENSDREKNQYDVYTHTGTAEEELKAEAGPSQSPPSFQLVQGHANTPLVVERNWDSHG